MSEVRRIRMMRVKALFGAMVWFLALSVVNVGAQAVRPEKKELEIAVAAFAHTTTSEVPTARSCG